MPKFKLIFTLGGLTIVGQLAPFVAVFWLSRVFSPESYQYFAEVLFFSMFAVVFATGRLEHVFVSLKKRRLSRVLATQILLMSVLVASLISLGYAYLSSRPESLSLACGVWSLIVSMSLYSVTSSQAISYELITQLSYARLVKGFCDALTPFLMVKFFDGWLALTLASAMSFLLPAIYLCIINGGLKFRKTPYIFYYLKSFSLYEVWSGGLNTLCNMLPVYFVSSAYGDKIAGIFSFVYRYFSAVSSLLFNTIGVVFRVDATKEKTKYGCYKRAFISTTRMSIAVSILLGVGILVVSLIGWDAVLGKEWGEDLGIVIFYFYILFFVKIVSLPISYSFYLASAVKSNLIFQMILFFLTSVICFLSVFVTSFYNFLLIYSVALSIYYLLYVYYAYRLSLGEV